MNNPEAKDSIQGILRWWLPSNGRVWSEECVETALAFLTAEGWFFKKTAGAETLYGAHPDRLNELGSLLEPDESDDEGDAPMGKSRKGH